MADSGQHGDEDLRLLGLYVTEFSGLVSDMRELMVSRLQQPANPPMVAWVVFAGAGAREIKTAFFAMARLVVDHDDDEASISRRLERRVEREIEQRNAIAHGDLQIGWWEDAGETEEEAEPLPATIERLQAREPVGFKAAQPDLEARCAAVQKLRQMIWNYGCVCLLGDPTDDVSEILRLDASGEIVPGPKATWNI